MRKLLVVLALFTALPVFAPTAAEAQTETDARRMFEQGNAHLQRAQRLRGAARARALREALTLYHRSLRVTRARSVLFNIAVCYEQLGRYQDAHSYYSEYLGLEDLTEQDREVAEERMAAISPHVALIEVSSEPPGATIYVDRRDLSPQGVTPVTVATQPGSHRIIGVLEGHESDELEVEAVLGQTREVALELTALPAQVRIETAQPGAEIRIDDESSEPIGVTPLEAEIPAGQRRIYAILGDRAGRTVVDVPPGGDLTVTVELGAPTTPGQVAIEVDVPEAEVRVDGEVVGTAPVRSLSLTPGVHRISVQANGDYQGWSEVVEIGPGHQLDLEVHLARSTPQRRFGPWPNVGMALATVLGVAAAATGGWALALHADFESIAESCGDAPQACGEGSVLRSDALDLEQRIHSMAITTDVLLVTAAAVAVTSFALMLLNREVEDRSRVTIAISPLNGGVLTALSVGGTTRLSP